MVHADHRLLLIGLAMGSVVAAGGCGGGDALNRQAVSGTVLLDGQPLESGSIRFEPQSAGTGGGTVIRAGKYALAKEVGLSPGDYQVAISGTAGDPGTPSMDDDAPQMAQELVPPQYNTQTTLSVTVTDNGSQQFDFSLETE